MAVQGYGVTTQFVSFGFLVPEYIYNMPLHVILCHVGHGACWMQQIPLAKGVAQSSKKFHPVLRKE
jgi:hypothetical protein